MENRKLHLGIPSHLLVGGWEWRGRCWNCCPGQILLLFLFHLVPSFTFLLYFLLLFLPLPLRRGPGNTKMIRITSLPSNSRSVGIGGWICNHICGGLKSTSLLFNHPLDPWPSSFLHISEFLPICSLLRYLKVKSLTCV